MALAGLGKKKIVFPDKRGDFKKLRATLEKEYPKLTSQRGAFELLRADKGGLSRPLVQIAMEQKGGYSIPYLKDVVSSTAEIYIKPMQSKLDLERLVQPSLCDDQVKTQCVNCERGRSGVEETAVAAFKGVAVSGAVAKARAARERAAKERASRGKAAEEWQVSLSRYVTQTEKQGCGWTICLKCFQIPPNTKSKLLSRGWQPLKKLQIRCVSSKRK